MINWGFSFFCQGWLFVLFGTNKEVSFSCKCSPTSRKFTLDREIKTEGERKQNEKNHRKHPRSSNPVILSETV